MDLRWSPHVHITTLGTVFQGKRKGQKVKTNGRRLYHLFATITTSSVFVCFAVVLICLLRTFENLSGPEIYADDVPAEVGQLCPSLSLLTVVQCGATGQRAERATGNGVTHGKLGQEESMH